MWPTRLMGLVAAVFGAQPESRFRKLRLKGNDTVFILVGDETEGAITAYDDYAAGLPSFAHLFPDGTILRYRRKIGTREDIEWL